MGAIATPPTEYASDILNDTSEFSHVMDSDDTTVQKCLDRVDEWGGDIESDIDALESAPPSHASSHHTGQSDALTPGDIGAEPADATIMKEGENVSLLNNDADYQSGSEVDSTIATHASDADAHHNQQHDLAGGDHNAATPAEFNAKITGDDFQVESEKGASNGYCPLGADSKVPSAYLDVAGLNYLGTWNASTNTPAIADGGSGDNAGDYYTVSVAGSQDLGSGTISFEVGDWVIYSGTVWQKIDNTDQVTSIFGRQGAVVAQSGDYSHSQIGSVGANDHHNQVHAIGSSDHTASTKANLDSKVSDASLFSTLANEIASITEKTAVKIGDKLLAEDSDDSNSKKMILIENILAIAGGVIIDAAGRGKYTSVVSAVNTEAEDTPFFIRDGLYTETADGAIKNGHQLIGESRQNTIITFNGADYQLHLTGDTPYSTGTVTLQDNLYTVQGAGTSWLGNLAAGDYIVVHGVPFEISTVDSDTQLTLVQRYEGSTRSGQAYYAGTFKRCHIENVTIKGQDTSALKGVLYLHGTVNCVLKNVEIKENDVTYSRGFYLDNSFGTRIERCYASANYHGMYIYDSDGTVVVNCETKNNAGAGIYLYDCDDSIVDGNRALYNGWGGGVYVGYSFSCIVSNNICKGNISHGIQINNSSSTEVIVEGNQCIENNYHGIAVYGSDNCVITGNICARNDYQNTQTYCGIYLNAYTDYCVVSNNRCRDNDLYEIWIDGGTGNKILDNDTYGTDHVQAIMNTGVDTEITYYVCDVVLDPDGEGNYTTVKDGAENESTGRTFYLKKGTFSEPSAPIIKAGQKFIGESRDETIIDLDGSGVSLLDQTTISFQASGNKILDSNSGFGSFEPGMVILINGSSANDFNDALIESCTADEIVIDPDTYTVSDGVAGAPIDIVERICLFGGSRQETFEEGGTLNLTYGDENFTGSGTTLTNLSPGDKMVIEGMIYEINTITDDTHAQFTEEYNGATRTGVHFIGGTFDEDIEFHNCTIKGHQLPGGEIDDCIDFRGTSRIKFIDCIFISTEQSSNMLTLRYAPNTEIQGCVFKISGQGDVPNYYGISATDSDGLRVINNTFEGIRRSVDVFNCDYINIESNYFYNCYGTTIDARGYAGKIVDNLIWAPNGIGIYAEIPFGQVSRNIIAYGSNNGMSIMEPHITVSQNTVYYCQYHGIYIHDYECDISNNMLYRNAQAGATYDGIHADGLRTRIYNNHVEYHPGYEISIQANQCYMEGNITYGSSHTGEVEIVGTGLSGSHFYWDTGIFQMFDPIWQMADTDMTNIWGRLASTFQRGSDYACLSHYDQKSSATGYGIAFSPLGDLLLNAITNREIFFGNNDTQMAAVGGAYFRMINAHFKDRVHTDDVSNPPTDAELDSIFGTPNTVGAGFQAYINDNGAGNNFYRIASDGTNWWVDAFTKAT